MSGKIRRYLSDGRFILRENSIFAVLQFLILSFLSVRKKMIYKCYGEQLQVRLQTPDIVTVKESLGWEFDQSIALVKSDHGVIIDAGGYIGSAAIKFARAFPNSKIITIEPSTENFEILKRNTSGYANIFAINAALSSKPGKIELKSRGTGEWGFTIAEESDDSANLQNLETVDMITVEEIFSRFEIDKVDLFKLDIEGGEYELLKGRPSWVDQCEVMTVELHDRIVSGCSRAYYNATDGRKDVWIAGEKVISVRSQAH